MCEPSPAPRLGRTLAGVRRPPPRAGAQTSEILVDHGLAEEEVAALMLVGALS